VSGLSETEKQSREHVAGLALAGGRSRRFGRDKAGVLLADRSLLAWSLACLDGVCAEVAVSAPAKSQAARLARRLGRAVLPDAPGHPSGPLAGIAAGLAWASGAGREFLATLPCDAPLVTGVVLETLLAAAQDTGGAFAVTPDGPHSLVAVWRSDRAEGLRRQLDAGEHPAVRHALAAAGARPVMFQDAGLFRNLNAPEDLAAAEAALAVRIG
jgi:molybdopterin-guanine dinucleotide biosynthesis protein A